MTEKKKYAVNLIAVLAIAAATEVFFILSLSYFAGEWSRALLISLLVIGTALNIALTTLEVAFYVCKKELLYKAMLSTLIFVVFTLLVLWVLLKTGFFAIMRDEAALEEYLRKFGVWMSVLFVVLQFLQVVVLPIPSFVTVAAGSALFGPLLSSFLSLLGILLGSITAFLIGRYLGYKAVAWLVGKETLDKWQKKIKGKDKLFLSAMFLLPIFPDDVLCFVAGLSSMSFLFFFVVILISRVIAVFVTSYSVSLIPFNTWWGITLWVLFFVGVAILFFFLYKKSDAIEAWVHKKFSRRKKSLSRSNKGADGKGEKGEK